MLIMIIILIIMLGKFVAIRGTVVRVSNIKQSAIQMTFQCSKCECYSIVTLKDGKYKAPTKCSTPNCRSKIFSPDYSSAITVDLQEIRYDNELSSIFIIIVVLSYQFLKRLSTSNNITLSFCLSLLLPL